MILSTKTLYATNESEFIQLKKEHEERGYIFEEKENKLGVFGVISDNVVNDTAKCTLCGSYIESRGCKSHGRVCEHCGEVIYLEMVENESFVRFKFENDPNWLYDGVTLLYHSWKEETKELRLFSKIFPSRNHNVEKVSEKLKEFSSDYRVERTLNGDEVYVFHYNLKGPMDEKTKINIYDTGGGLNHVTSVSLYEGKEYSFPFEELPIPRYVDLIQDWRIEKNIKEIVRRSGMSSDPQYYTGRGANRGDINETHLVKIYTDVCSYFGETAADGFLELVYTMPNLRATDFLKALYRLETNQWVFDENTVIDASADGVDIRNMSGFLGTLLNTNYIQNINETKQIKQAFFLKVGNAFYLNIF